MRRLSPGGIPVALPALLLFAFGCAGKVPGPVVEQDEPPISVDRILDRPERFIGDRVRLSADVADSYGNRMFTLKDDDPMMKEQILVVTRRPIPPLLGEERTLLKTGDELLVSGVIRPGDIADIEAELGVDLDAKLEDRFRGKPILVASEVIRTDVKESDVPDTLAPPDN